MKESTKGALLSLLVYPGAGQLALGRRSSGVFFAALTTAGLLVIMYRITVRFYSALDPNLSTTADMALQWSEFVNTIRHGPYNSWQVEGFCLISLIACWIFAGVHACLTGRRIDRKSG